MNTHARTQTKQTKIFCLKILKKKKTVVQTVRRARETKIQRQSITMQTYVQEEWMTSVVIKSVIDDADVDDDADDGVAVAVAVALVELAVTLAVQFSRD